MLLRLCVVIGLLLSGPAWAADVVYPDGVEVVQTQQPFARYLAQLKTAIGANKMGIVGLACATCGAKNIGVKIAENRVVMIFNPHFAVRMLKASIPAGVEAPLRLYLVEQADGSAVLSYQKPSRVFAPYKNPELDQMALELDQIVAAIVAQAGR